MALKAAEILAKALEEDACAQEQGALGDQSMRIENVCREIRPINDIPRPIFKLALKFWKQWALASQHSWHHGGSISESEWPEMARIIAQHVRIGTLPNNKLILDNFVRKRRSLSWRDLKSLFEKGS